jgi:DNA-binding winged helix-turn-helix (wHTH) protein
VRVEFGEFVFDSDRRQLLCRREPVHLSRKAFDALGILLERRPDAVTKEELHARLWPGTFVSDANLSVVIAEVRKALGDEPQSPRFIRTVHRIGYAFTAERDEPEVGSTEQHAPDAWLVWNERALPLSTGEQVIGRDPACAIWLDGTGVSRRHARIHVERDTATLEDLGSKNGTSVNGVLLASACRLADGDRITLGQVDLEFRTRSGTRETKTVRLKERRK